MDIARVKKYRNWGLLDIAQDYGFTFNTVGGKLRGLCLFHGDKGSPNMFIYPDDTFFCFACKRGWSKSQFVAFAEKVPRKTVETLWEKSTCIVELLDMKLKKPATNYRDALLLLLAKFWYNNKGRNTYPYTQKLKDIDAEISSKDFIDFAMYSRLIKEIEEIK
jgi:hypothetical protein